MKGFLVIFSVLVSFSISAESISYKTRELKGIIKSGINLEQVQAQMGCVFENAQGNIIDTRVSPFTRISPLGNGEFQVIVRPGSYREILPSYRLSSCHFKLIVLGRNDAGRAFLEDVFVIGSDRDVMEKADLEIFHDKNAISEKIESLLNPLTVF